MDYKDFLEAYEKMSVDVHYFDERFYKIKSKGKMFQTDGNGLLVFIKELELTRNKIKHYMHLLKQDTYKLKEDDFDTWLLLLQNFSILWHDINVFENDVISIYEELKIRVIPDRRVDFFEENTSILPFVLESVNPVDEIKVDGIDGLKIHDENLGSIKVYLNNNIIEFFETHEKYNLVKFVMKLENIDRKDIGAYFTEIYKDPFNKYVHHLNSSEEKCKCESIANLVSSKLNNFEDYNVDKIKLLKRLHSLYSNIKTISAGEPIEFKHRKKQKYIKL